MTGGRKTFLIVAVLLAAVLVGLIFIAARDWRTLTQYGEILPGSEKPTRHDKEPGEQFNPASLTWESATSSAEWQTRDSAASFVFSGKMWTMGGLDGNRYFEGGGRVRYWEAPHFNDIWSSEDGTVWKLEKEHAEWPLRRSMTVVEFRGKLLMFGGWSKITGYDTRDVWQSEDGITWNNVASSTPWSAREGHTAEVFGGRIWIFGGVNYDERKTKNDVWYSEDGINWHEATTTIPWSTRWDHATAVFKGKIFLTGGMDLKGGAFNDEWVSSDGLNWELVATSSPWASRQGHSMVVLKDRLWIVGRLNDDSAKGGPNDVWYSEDGVNWQKTDTDPPWLGREDESILVYKDKIWVFGGMGSDWKWHNDVWYSKFP